jgi:hypothetical protein
MGLVGETTQVNGSSGGEFGSGDRHVDVVARRDYVEFRKRLADDVAFHSPAARFNFRGAEITAALFETAVKLSDPDKWKVKEFWDLGDTHLMSLTSTLGGRKLDLVTVTRFNDEGKITDSTFYARPMAAIACYPAFVFPQLVRRFHGPIRAALVWAICRPLPRILEIGVIGVLRLGNLPGTDFGDLAKDRKE